MVDCVKLSSVKKQVKVGDLNKKVELYSRLITAPSNPYGDEPDYFETFQLIATMWCMIETPSMIKTFDSIGIEQVITHNFYCRYRDDVTNESYLLYDSNYYRIINYIDMSRERLFLKMATVFRGSDIKEASNA